MLGVGGSAIAAASAASAAPSFEEPLSLGNLMREPDRKCDGLGGIAGAKGDATGFEMSGLSAGSVGRLNGEDGEAVPRIISSAFWSFHSTSFNFSGCSRYWRATSFASSALRFASSTKAFVSLSSSLFACSSLRSDVIKESCRSKR